MAHNYSSVGRPKNKNTPALSEHRGDSGESSDPTGDYFDAAVLASIGSSGSGGRIIGVGLVTFVGFGGSDEELSGLALRDVGLSSNVGNGGTGRLPTGV